MLQSAPHLALRDNTNSETQNSSMDATLSHKSIQQNLFRLQLASGCMPVVVLYSCPTKLSLSWGICRVVAWQAEIVDLIPGNDDEVSNGAVNKKQANIAGTDSSNSNRRSSTDKIRCCWLKHHDLHGSQPLKKDLLCCSYVLQAFEQPSDHDIGR